MNKVRTRRVKIGEIPSSIDGLEVPIFKEIEIVRTPEWELTPQHVVPKRTGEFTCPECFLVKNEAFQLTVIGWCSDCCDEPLVSSEEARSHFNEMKGEGNTDPIGPLMALRAEMRAAFAADDSDDGLREALEEKAEADRRRAGWDAWADKNDWAASDPAFAREVEEAKKAKALAAKIEKAKKAGERARKAAARKIK